MQGLDDPVGDVEAVGEVAEMVVEGPGDDSEGQVEVCEEGRETDQGQVKVRPVLASSLAFAILFFAFLSFLQKEFQPSVSWPRFSSGTGN